MLTVNVKGQRNMITDKVMEKEVVVSAPVSEVWKAFTTEDGVKTFFAPGAKVELKLGGAYEMYFDLSQPKGFQGGEDLHVLSFLDQKMFSFEWNAPPSFGELRGIKTWVILYFEQVDKNTTIVKLNHTGWRQGEDWDALYNYFVRAWDIVLGRLKVRFESGPIDWENPSRP